jgi:uncharacterized OB-fold protein
MPVGVIARDEQSATFFDGTQRGELLIRSCAACGHLNAPPAEACAKCNDVELSWVAASGRAQVVTFVVIHGRGAPPPRTVVAIVELAEGPWLHSQLVDVDPDAVSVGDPLVVRFEQPDGGEAIPVFRPA